MIRTAKAIESKIKIRSTPVEHLRFMSVHDAAHENIEGGASQQGHLILAVHASITNCRVPVSVLSWQSKKIKRVVRSSQAAEASCMSPCQEHLNWMRTMWAQMTSRVPQGSSQHSCHRLQEPSRCNSQRRSSTSVCRQEIGD